MRQRGLGGFINLGIQLFSGNIHNVGQFYGAFAVGALAGLTGAWLGGVVSTAVGGGIGFIGGAAVGASGGAAGGLIGGAGNAWLNGASFSDGLMAGLKGAGMGALAGGIIGGISGGINAVAHHGNFWTGIGYKYTYDSKDLTGIVSKDKAVFKTREEMLAYLKNYGLEPGKYNITDISNVNTTFSGNTADPNILYYRDPDTGIIQKVTFGGKLGMPISTENIGATTQLTKITWNCTTVNIYMSPFDNVRDFTIAFNHELIHSYQIGLGLASKMGKAFENYTEGSAYTYSYYMNPSAFNPNPYSSFMNTNWPKYLIPLSLP